MIEKCYCKIVSYNHNHNLRYSIIKVQCQVVCVFLCPLDTAYIDTKLYNVKSLKNAHFIGVSSIFYILKIVVFMNNVGVLKTKNGSAIFNNRLSWFIYTPTEKFKNCQENPYFLILYTNFIPISHPISSNNKKINTFTHLPSQISTHNPNHFLPI